MVIGMSEYGRLLTPRQLRKYRAIATVEMLRTTWEKTTNPYVSPVIEIWDTK